MPRVVLALAACAALLSGCATYSAPVSKPSQPAGDPVFISLQVEQHLNKYYRTIGGGRSGAFAVSQKGTVGFYAYCQSVQCRDEISFSRTALQGCEARAHAACVLLAVGRSVRHPYMTYKEAEDKGLI
ncbi:MAG TPA: hypothetical protein VGQ35_17070 [Dongiaceae bacterium]|jgi:hypothetical protein|nr:hypothetical protein [Dongiaceae bacterium]